LETLIPFEDFKLDTLHEILDTAVIDFQPHDNSSIYVTGHDFPTFWKIDFERQFLAFSTYLDAVEGADEAELLEFTNACNRRLMFVQFSYHSDSRRFCGHHVISVKDGLNTKQVIRTGRLFASVFDDAATDETLDKYYNDPEVGPIVRPMIEHYYVLQPSPADRKIFRLKEYP
jgi:hypothetical protein